MIIKQEKIKELTEKLNDGIKELKELQKKMEVIRSTANTIITSIETELLKETQTQQEKPTISICHRRR